MRPAVRIVSNGRTGSGTKLVLEGTDADLIEALRVYELTWRKTLDGLAQVDIRCRLAAADVLGAANILCDACPQRIGAGILRVHLPVRSVPSL